MSSPLNQPMEVLNVHLKGHVVIDISILSYLAKPVIRE